MESVLLRRRQCELRPLRRLHFDRVLPEGRRRARQARRGRHPHGEERPRHARGVLLRSSPSREQLTRISGGIDAGELRVVVGAAFPLAEARQAYVQKPTRGKVILVVDS
ncbi:MAG: zinc-binding dehydrogenase [Deltaproteobacteria bacterium]|nr:zinc-binding dehydrogenase [Deltaproteobacteria bacterium]